MLKRLVRLDAYDWENAISLADPQLRCFPVIYMVEPGYMDVSNAEVAGLRGYLDAGGFLIVDHFWGQRQFLGPASMEPIRVQYPAGVPGESDR